MHTGKNQISMYVTMLHTPGATSSEISILCGSVVKTRVLKLSNTVAQYTFHTENILLHRYSRIPGYSSIQKNVRKDLGSVSIELLVRNRNRLATTANAYMRRTNRQR